MKRNINNTVNDRNEDKVLNAKTMEISCKLKRFNWEN